MLPTRHLLSISAMIPLPTGPVIAGSGGRASVKRQRDHRREHRNERNALASKAPKALM